MARVKVEKNISYDPERKLYYVTLYRGKVKGKFKKETITFRNKKEARECLKRFEYEKEIEVLAQPNNETVSTWLDYWLEDVQKPQIAETTYLAYKNITKHIKAEIGGISLKKLKSKDIQMYLRIIVDPEGVHKLSANTAIKHLTLMKTAFGMAVKQQELYRNPADAVLPPKYKQPDINFYTPEQVNKLFQVFEKNIILKPAIYLAALLGLRREEICGLRWENVDLEHRILYVIDARTVAGDKIVEKDAKSFHSTRKLFIDDFLYQKLIEIKEEQISRSEMLGDAYTLSGYVEVNEDGNPVNPGYLSSKFHKWICSNDLAPISLHGLRHTVASIANAGGMTQFDISKMLGHSSPSVTGKIYTHMFDEVQTKVVNKVSEMIKENVDVKQGQSL